MIKFTDPLDLSKDKTINSFVTKDNILTIPGEELFDGTYIPDDIVKIKTDNPISVAGKTVNSNNTKIFVKEKEGIPDVYKELEEANEYKQLSVYEDYSNLVWEGNLTRDYINNINLEASKEQYTEEYIKIVKGNK